MARRLGGLAAMVPDSVVAELVVVALGLAVDLMLDAEVATAALLADERIATHELAEFEEVANLVVMLASPLMHMVNGTMIEIDGGQDKALMDKFRDKPKG